MLGMLEYEVADFVFATTPMIGFLALCAWAAIVEVQWGVPESFPSTDLLDFGRLLVVMK